MSHTNESVVLKKPWFMSHRFESYEKITNMLAYANYKCYLFLFCTDLVNRGSFLTALDINHGPITGPVTD